MSTGWICPKCGRVYAPFICECSNCNNNEIKPDPCIITPPWSQDYSKYKSEVTTDTYKCGQNVTIDNEYLKYTTSREFNNDCITYTYSNQEPLQENIDEFNTNLDRSIHKYSGQEPFQESINELNTELENLGVQPTNLDELKDIKTIIEDVKRSEEIAQDKSNNTLDKNTSTQDSSIDFLRRAFPNGGINRGKPRIITKCEHCGATTYLNRKCPICNKFNGDKSLELDTNYMLEHWICSRCGKIHLVFPEGGCECGAPLEYLTYVI